MPYLSQNGQDGLRPPSANGVKAAKGVGGVNRESPEPALGVLSAKAVAAETRRSKSGPALALGGYLEKPTEERLEWLTKAVLQIRGMDTADWEPHAGAVKAAAEDPSNHPLDCGCEECA